MLGEDPVGAGAVGREQQPVHPAVGIPAARPQPICTSHGHTVGAGASIVIAWVVQARALGSSSSPTSACFRSWSVAPQVCPRRYKVAYPPAAATAAVAPLEIGRMSFSLQ